LAQLVPFFSFITEWPVLPQLVQVNVDLTIIEGTTSLTLALAYGVVNRAL
jgi:hypothetical protein